MWCLGGLVRRAREGRQRCVPTGVRSFVEAHLLPDLHEAVIGRLVQLSPAAVLVLELLAPVLERGRRAGNRRPGTRGMGHRCGPHRRWLIGAVPVGMGAGGTPGPTATLAGSGGVAFAAALIEP